MKNKYACPPELWKKWDEEERKRYNDAMQRSRDKTLFLPNGSEDKLTNEEWLCVRHNLFVTCM